MTQLEDLPRLRAVETGDAALDDITGTADALRARGRQTLGVTGDSNTEPIVRLLRRYGVSAYPLVALGLLAVCDQFQAVGISILSPDIAVAIGVGFGGIAASRAIALLAQALSPFPTAALVQHRARRALLCIVTGIAWSVVTLFTGFVVSAAGLFFILVLDGLSSGSVVALHAPLVMDSYPPGMRVRAMAAYSALLQFGLVLSPLLVAVMAGPLNLTWRGVFIGLGLVSTLMSVAAIGLRDPGFGKWDTDRLRETVHSAHGESETLSKRDVGLGFWEIVRRVTMIPTNHRVFGAGVVLGIFLVPFQTFVSFFLQQQWDMGTSARGWAFVLFNGVTVVGLVLYGGRGEKQFRASPARAVRFSGYTLAGGIVFILLGGLSPWLPGTLVSFSIAWAVVNLLVPVLYIALLSLVPAGMRPHAQSMLAIAIAVGGLLGTLLLGQIVTQYSQGVAIAVLAAVGIAGGAALGSASKHVEGDLDRMIDAVLEDEEVERIKAGGGHLPMLACRSIDFSYGQLQVLFDVNFTVDDGEMVALLGVNGAGKSTLLKVISGIGLPSRGSVRYRGQDITFLDAERRLRLGITQIPGGRAVFGPMTVVENLRTFGYTMGGGRREVQRGIDTCFEAFPRLYERRSSLAATLSGGEQQMLGLSKALMLKPRLLLIDELSLGLAPVIVGQLLDMVRRINAEGTAVVLVEQSVNIALNLVEHAYFMEKGEMRFDGRAADLLARDDLLRAVFLQGAGAAT